MSNKLLNHSPDLQRLWKAGYAVQISGTYLLIHDVPYVSPSKQIKRGTLISLIELNGDRTIPPKDHVARFIGECPSKVDGSPLTTVIGSNKEDYGGFEINHTLSAKVEYADHFEKIERYISIIMNPALEYDETLSAKTFAVFEPEENTTVFKYLDTNTSRARIHAVSRKLEGYKIAILGVGGTGSYLLDFLAKTPVAEIHLFDNDDFIQHNAFRAPGAAALDNFYEHLKKVDYYTRIYSNMHRFIIPHPYHMDETKLEELAVFDYIFICMDDGEKKKSIVDYLESAGKTFIDTGLGVSEIDGRLKGQAKIVMSVPNNRDQFKKHVSFKPTQKNIYDQNIQIAELNAINAIMAIIKWKQVIGFYHDSHKPLFSSFAVSFNEMINDDFQI